MPRKTPDQGVEAFEVRPGLGFPRFRGMNRSADPANIPLDQFHLQVNVRLTPAGMVDRPGLKETHDSLAADCITGMLETGERPAAALWSYNEWAFRPGSGSDYEGFYAAIDGGKPLDLPSSPLYTIFSNKGTLPANPLIDPGKIELYLSSTIFSQRLKGAFLFQGKIVQIKLGTLSQITDVKFDLDADLSTGKLQKVFDFIDVDLDIADFPDPVVKQERGENNELDPGEPTSLKDVLYGLSENAGELIRFDGVTAAVELTGGVDTYTTLCSVLGQGLVAIGPAEIAYQAEPGGAWTITAHTYSNGVFDCVEWRGLVYFIGRVLGTDQTSTNIVTFSPVTKAVTDVQVGVPGTAGEFFMRLTPTKRGLLFFRSEETTGPNKTLHIGMVNSLGFVDRTWLQIGFIQDFVPCFFSHITEIGSRVFYSVDATPEFVWPTGFPPDFSNVENVGAIFEIGFGPDAVKDFYVEYIDPIATDARSSCPTWAVPIGPIVSLGTVF